MRMFVLCRAGQTEAAEILVQAEPKGCCCSPKLTFYELHVVCLQGAALAGERHVEGPAAWLLMCSTGADLGRRLSAEQSFVEEDRRAQASVWVNPRDRYFHCR